MAILMVFSTWVVSWEAECFTSIPYAGSCKVSVVSVVVVCSEVIQECTSLQVPSYTKFPLKYLPVNLGGWWEKLVGGRESQVPGN